MTPRRRRRRRRPPPRPTADASEVSRSPHRSLAHTQKISTGLAAAATGALVVDLGGAVGTATAEGRPGAAEAAGAGT